jgi:hypothetical protein
MIKFSSVKSLLIFVGSILPVLVFLVFNTNLHGQCTCTGNLAQNPSFESYTNGHPNLWNSSPINRFNVYGGFQQCGVAYGATDSFDGTDVSIYQQIGSIAPGTQYRLAFFGGTHTPAGSHYFGIRFYNASGSLLSESIQEVDYDVDPPSAPGSLELYTIIATAPATTNYLRLVGFSTENYLKLDQVCMAPCPTISTTVTGTISICSGAGTTVTAAGSGGTAPYTYEWSTGATTASLSVTPATSTIYTVTTTSANGCTGTRNVTVTVNPKPTADAGPDGELNCITTSTKLDGTSSTPGVSYAWVASSGGNITSGANTAAPTVNAAGTYTLTVTTSAGCSSSDATIVTINTTPPIANAGDDISICEGTNTNLTATGGGSYVWSNNATTATITVAPSLSTTYNVIVTSANGCTASDAVVVTVNEKINVGDFVWIDNDFDGNQDISELGVNGISVKLYNTANQLLQTTTTSNQSSNPGYYNFNVCAGTYYIVFGQNGTMVRSPQRATADDAKDSDANPTTGRTDNFVLTYGNDIATIDAGYAELASLGNYVWEDLDRDGYQDNSEPAISGVQVQLSGTDGHGQNVSLNTSTNVAGAYAFTNLVPGTYTVTFTKPLNFFTTSTDNVGDDATDSDASTTNGSTPSVDLQSGENNTTIDAGYYKCANVGNYIWNDNPNPNDLQDNGEVGMNGISVSIFLASDLSTPLFTTVTSNNPTNSSLKGYYNFQLCDVNEYVISVSKPSDMIFVNGDMSTDDSEDSDIMDHFNGRTSSFFVSYAENDQTIDIGLRSAPLPVKLTDFAATWQKSGAYTTIAWETASEINTNYFVVERSIDNVLFDQIEKVKASGYSNGKMNYKSVDRSIQNSGIFYYRLKIVDFDGKEDYSQVNQVNANIENSDFEYNIFPNPAESVVNININSEIGSQLNIDIYNQNGQIIQKNSILDTAKSSKSMYRFETSEWEKGIYLVKITVDQQTKIHKLVIL